MDSNRTEEPDKKSFNRQTSRGRIVRRLAIILFVSVAALFLLSMTSPQPTNLGVNNGMLAKCPEKPNCVSTQADDAEHRMPAIPFQGDADEMVEKIKLEVQSRFSRAKLVGEIDHYLRFEFRSLIFRFVDDVEFFVDDKASVVHFRSASRVGHSDMGTNRKRMIQITESLKR